MQQKLERQQRLDHLPLLSAEMRLRIDFHRHAHEGDGEFLLDAMNGPGILHRFDFVGDQLYPSARELWQDGSIQEGYGRANKTSFQHRRLTELFPPDIAPDDPAHWAELNQARENITEIGAEKGWSLKSLKKSAPFDEPALGIVGMWRQGLGANPHFALALGEIMLRVGQRFIAWTAFERAARMAEQFWPDPAIQQVLRDHCQNRQTQIEESLRRPAYPLANTDPVPQAEIATLRERFDAELAHGESFQRAYQDYEAAKIAAGASIDDEHFYDDFHAGRPSIGTPPGSEEWLQTVRGGSRMRYAWFQFFNWGSLAAGIMAMGVALFPRSSRRSPPA